MVGTLYNAGAVALGAAVGLAFRGRLTESGKDAAFLAAGLFTLGLGIRMVAGMQHMGTQRSGNSLRAPASSSSAV